MVISVYLMAVVVIFMLFYWKIVIETLKERKRVIDLMANLEGPLAVPILGTTWQFKWNITGLTKQMADWARSYGSQGHGLMKFWLGPRPIVIVLKPEIGKVILESQDLLTKGPEYDPLMLWLGTGLLTSTGAKWRNRRKLLTPSFHFKMLTDFVHVHNKQAQIFLSQIEQFADTDVEFDIFPWIKRAALDIICESAMGTCVSAQTNHDHPYVTAVSNMNQLAFKSQRMPWLRLKPLWQLTIGPEFEENLKIVTDFTREVIDIKMRDPIADDPDRKKVFLDNLIELERGGELTYDDIREEVDTFMFEGHDTTSASMGWTIWILAHYPEYQQKIFDEVDEIFGESDRGCTNDDLKQMKFLEWCIKESLRMRPSVPTFSRALDKDLTVDGTVVPKGVSILISPALFQHIPAIYPEPDTFDPLRFSEENISGRYPYAYIPFSAGPRNCIGQKFALMEEKAVLSWFFRRYSASSDLPILTNLAIPEIILRPSMGFPLKLNRRTKMAKC